MNPSLLTQICETIDTGIFVIDRDFIVRYWNRWMEVHSDIPPDEIMGRPVFERFPMLEDPKFVRACRTILAFGNHSFLSQKLHSFLIPLKTPSTVGGQFTHMQQSCSLFPMRDTGGEIIGVCVCINDMTDVVAYELRLIGLSIQDSLTGVYNRRHLTARLREEFERFRRHGRPVGLIMLDVDHFKRVNDNFGHQCGDHMLIEIAGVAASKLRKIDLLARYGGEEFCCVLPDTELADVLAVAERMRETTAETEFKCGDDTVRLTISLGVTQIRKDTVNMEMLLREADDALYEAKRAGRNKVVTHPANL